MVYNQVEIYEMVPGAVLGDVVHDQWIVAEVHGKRVFIFDQEAVCPRSLIGEKARVKIGVTPVEIEECALCEAGFLGRGNFAATVIKVLEKDEGFEYILDVKGLKLHLSLSQRYVTGSRLKIEGRLDLIDIDADNKTGWRNCI